jgi:hypothetical protein
LAKHGRVLNNSLEGFETASLLNEYLSRLNQEGHSLYATSQSYNGPESIELKGFRSQTLTTSLDTKLINVYIWIPARR